MPTISVMLDYGDAGVTTATGSGGSWSVRLLRGYDVPLLVSAQVPGFPDEPVSVTFGGSACTPVKVDDGFFYQGTHRCATGQSVSGSYEVTVQDGLGRSVMGSTYISIW